MEKIVDIIDENILKKAVGKNLKSICCEEELFRDKSSITTFSSGLVQLIMDDYIYNMTAYEKEEYDYFGEKEEVAIFELEVEPYSEEKIIRYGGIRTEINKIIKSIQIVNENQKLFENGKQTYDVTITRGVILYFDDFEISFEKNVWFAEYVSIEFGNNLIERFSNPAEFVEDWEGWDETRNIKAECEREIIILGKPVE